MRIPNVQTSAACRVPPVHPFNLMDPRRAALRSVRCALLAVVCLMAAAHARSQSWYSQATLLTARTGCASVTGPDGRVYAIGGLDASRKILNTVEAYDSSTGNWTAVAPMTTARAWAAAVCGPDGRIYAIGGSSSISAPNAAALASVEAYDPAANTWRTVAPISGSRLLLGASLGADGRIYAVGGFDNLWNALTTAEAYNPDTNAWTTVASLKTPRGALGAVTAWNGLLYAIGGSPTASFKDGVGTAEAYDPALDKWTPIAPANGVHDGSGTVLGSDGRIYLFGGIDTSGAAISAVEAYDPALNTWTVLSPMPTPLADMGATMDLDSKVYAIGGFTGSYAYGYGAQNQTLTLDDSIWAQLPPMSTARYNGPGGAALPDGRILAIGGSDYSGKSVSSAEAYDYRTETWSPIASMSTPRSFVGVTAGPKGSVYAIGGRDDNGITLGTVEVYNPALDKWSAGVPLLTARSGCAAVTAPDGRIYAIGGADANGNILYTTEVFDPSTNTWSFVAVLNTNRTTAAAVVGFDGLIYALGGWNPLIGSLNSVEVYDPTANTWTPAPSMTTPRSGPVAIAAIAGNKNSAGYNAGIIALGGDAGSPLDSLEFLGAGASTWASLGTMLTARWAPGAAVANAHGYVFGGRDAGYNALPSAEAHPLNIAPVSLAVEEANSDLRVTLDAPAPPTGLLVALTSSDPTSLAVPGSLFIKPGTNSGTSSFPIPPGSVPVTVSATFQGTTLSKTVLVKPAHPVRSISVTPAGTTVAYGTPVRLTVTATYRDGTTADVSTDPLTAYTVNHGVGTLTGNTYTSNKTEAAVITVSYTSGGVTVTGASYITETAPGHGRIVSSAFTPYTTTVTYPTPVTFAFNVTYQDTTTVDVSASPNTAYTLQHGLGALTGNSYASTHAESAVIVATYTDPTSGQAITKAAYVNETAPITLKRIAVSPLISTVAHGTPVTFHVIATYSDGSTKDVTGSAGFSIQHGVGALLSNTYTSPRPEAAVVTASYTEGGVTVSNVAYVNSN